MPTPQRSLESLSGQEAVGLLSAALVGRVVFSVGALPAVVPVTFAVLDHAVVLRTAADTRLAAAADGAVLAFEVDEVDPVTRTGWSVVVTGVAEVVTDAFRRALIHSVVEPFAPGDHQVYIRIPLSVVTGRRVTAGVQPVGASGHGGRGSAGHS